jgi:hypothetical protein
MSFGRLIDVKIDEIADLSNTEEPVLLMSYIDALVN